MMNEGWRFACVFLQDFAVEVNCRTRKYDQSQPVVLIDSKEHARVKAFNQSARNGGVTFEQPLSHARNLVPDLIALPWHKEIIADATRQMVEVFKKVSPRVESRPDWPGIFWLDARGMRWLGGESGLAQRAIELMKTYGYHNGRIGIADSMMTAQAAAIKSLSPGDVRIIPSQMDQYFLQDLLLSELNLPPFITDTLMGLGIRHVRDLLSIPVPALASRFGFDGLAAWRMAQGDDVNCLGPENSFEPPEAVIAFDTPIDTLTPVLFSLRGLVESLVRQLAYESMAASCLNLILCLEDGSENQHLVAPVRPTADVSLLVELIKVRLEKIYARPLESSLIEIRIRVLELSPGHWQQSHLGHQKWNPNAIERALDMINGRYEQPVVFEVVSVADPRPEHRARWSEVSTVPIRREQTEVDTDTPVHLGAVRRMFKVPLPVDVRLDGFHQPIAFFWDKHWRNIDARGPERLSGHWWQSPFAYEDYRFILNDSSVFWARRDAHINRWMLMGWFD